MRVLAKGGQTGVEEYTRLLFDEMLKKDSRNNYALFYNALRKVPLPEAWIKENNVSVIDTHIPNKLFELSERFLFWPKVDNWLKPDLVFSPHFNILRLKPKTKRVIVFHDLSFFHYPEFFSPRKRFWHWEQDVQRQIEQATKIIAVSETTRTNILETFNIAPEKVQTIHSGVNPIYELLAKDNKELGRFWTGKNLGDRFLLYVGTLEPRKNIPAVIETFNILKARKEYNDLKLMIVGKPGWLCEEIFAAAKRSSVAKEIIFWGAASANQLLYFYNLASVFIYPSFFEGFGFPPLEAQACGLPVITSNNSSLKEIFSGSAKLIDPKNPNEIAEAAHQILSDSKLANQLRKQGLENAKKFSWSKTAEKVLNLIESL